MILFLEQGTSLDTFLGWVYSTEHHSTIIEPTYETGGYANFWYDSDNSGENYIQYGY